MYIQYTELWIQAHIYNGTLGGGVLAHILDGGVPLKLSKPDLILDQKKQFQYPISDQTEEIDMHPVSDKINHAFI